MIIALIILGAFIGGISHGFWGAALGAVLGYVWGATLDTRRRLIRLEQVLDWRNQEQESSGAPADFQSAPRAEPQPLRTEPLRTEPLQTGAAMEEPQPSSEAEEALPEIEWTPEASQELPSGKPFKKPRDAAPAYGEEWSDRLSPLKEAVERFLSGGNLLVKVGVIVLFVGVSFLLKYAADHSLVPIELRLAAAVLGGMALLILGWRLRTHREAYALVLQGGGVGVLYLTVFAALRLYSLIPPALAFAVLVAVGILSAALAVLQNAPSLAVLGVSGGFLAPILASTGHGSHVMLFSYYALLNAGIVGIAWFKTWRILNLVGFTFTFGLGSMWGYQYYQPKYFATTEPFLILFFLFYAAVAVLFALRQSPQLRGYVDGTIAFGTPLLVFGLQAMLVRPIEHGIALSALALGLFYLTLAWILFLKVNEENMRALTEAFLAIGVVFGTLTIPLALDNRWTSSAWALEGAALVWIGVRQQRRTARAFGLLVQVLAGVAFIESAGRATGKLPVLNGFYLACVIIAFAALFTAFYLHKNRQKILPWEYAAGNAMAVWGVAWWFSAGVLEISRHLAEKYQAGGFTAFISLSCLACNYLENSLKWPLLRYPALGLLPALYFIAMSTLQRGMHPFKEAGFAGWPLAFAVYYRILHNHEGVKEGVLRGLHAGIFWLLVWIVAWELSRQTSHWAPQALTWSLIWWGLAPSLLVLGVATSEKSLPWPIGKHYGTYLTLVLAPVALYACYWTLHVNFTESGDPFPLSYFPLLNPLDITMACTFIALAAWFLKLGSVGPEASSPLPSELFQILTSIAPVLYAASIFVWLNAILARTIHFWAGVGFGWKPMMDSVLFQTSLSIFWSLSALCVMLISTRRSLRNLWLTGAGLLGVVVLKLFLVDLSKSGTISRIVSFLVVGILLLVVGYFSPVPPKTEAETK